MATKDEARDALYDAIVKVAEKADNYGGVTGSAMVRDASIAWRALVGGAQPGSVVVESK